MNNSDFWASIDSIIADGFKPKGLQQLDLYAKQFIDGRIIYKRFSPFEQRGCSAGGTSHVIASILAGAKNHANSDNQETLTDFQRECQQASIRINTSDLRVGGIRQHTTEIAFKE